MLNGILEHFGVENYAWKVGIIQKIFAIFSVPTVPLRPGQKVSIPSDQNLLILLVSNVYNGNVGAFWHRKLRMKTWYSSKLL